MKETTAMIFEHARACIMLGAVALTRLEPKQILQLPAQQCAPAICVLSAYQKPGERLWHNADTEHAWSELCCGLLLVRNIAHFRHVQYSRQLQLQAVTQTCSEARSEPCFIFSRMQVWCLWKCLGTELAIEISFVRYR